MNPSTSCQVLSPPGGRGGRTVRSLALKVRFMRVAGDEEVLEISTVERQEAEGILKQWKMDGVQYGRSVFTLSVVSLFGPLLCQEGSQRAQLSIQRVRWQAKNTPLHALWNTLPLFTCLLTPPDLFTRPSQ